MKKLLLSVAIIICSFLSAQNTYFNEIYSTKDLYKIQKTIVQNHKDVFYKQMLKAKLFELIKSDFRKNYSDIILQKFSDTIIARYDESQSVDYFSDMQTYEEFLKNHIEYISRTPEDVAKNNTLNFYAKDSLGSSAMKIHFGDNYIEKMNNEDNDRIAKASKKTDLELRKEYDSIKNAHYTEIENDFHSENNRKKIISKLDLYFSTKRNSDDELFDLLVENLAPEFKRTFPYPHKYAEFPISEVISGDIISYAENGGGNVTSIIYYKIFGNDILPITIYPDKPEKEINFNNQLKKFISLDEFYLDNVILEKKDGKGNYLISGIIKPVNSDSEYQIKYSTKDFISFVPLQYRELKEKAKWINIQ
ncbi:hypothetical protein [Chryseobacterium sp.]|uniref:hypothetical protein n=1 Tax=Chryseobacterium sp. TaxID=1871047 RepID=UPI002FC66D3F